MYSIAVAVNLDHSGTRKNVVLVLGICLFSFNHAREIALSVITEQSSVFMHKG